MVRLSPRFLSGQFEGLNRQLGLQLTMGGWPVYFVEWWQGIVVTWKELETKCFISIPFAHTLGQVVGTGLLCPGAAGRLRKGPPPLVSLPRRSSLLREVVSRVWSLSRACAFAWHPKPVRASGMKRVDILIPANVTEIVFLLSFVV